MYKALPHFADPKFLQMLLAVAFEKWFKEFIQSPMNRRDGWEESDGPSVVERIIAPINAIHLNATVADVIKMEKRIVPCFAPDLEHEVELFELFLEWKGCWLKGELENRSYWSLFERWYTTERMKSIGSHGTAARYAQSAVNRGMRVRLGHEPTIGEFGKLKLSDAWCLAHVGPATLKVINAFRADCGMKPLK